MALDISQGKKNAHASSEYIHGIGSFLHFSARKRKGVDKALNSLAIKQAMPARNAGTGGLLSRASLHRRMPTWLCVNIARAAVDTYPLPS